ncbi:bifunctional metallophosphatase/5'-nucleotidase [Marinilactibacillus kalidii]|uniref:bifunctional metallophosphatase/5'-nucleotidase n=1 Tax=Marinilactibacillus kalidii TaxID=2820274 RepID=UPI001FCA0DD6|nr:bifunctional metallophosphatase/5'-nucleotidase [Marinilactibacillus kalidii]
MLEKVTIYHTNDIHSHLDHWPRTAAFLREKREIHRSQLEDCYIFDIGDACDRVHPLTEATDGKAMTRLLNDAHYDAATIGNNEGIGSTKEQLDHLYDQANFDVILSNLTDRSSGVSPNWASTIKLYKTKEQTRIGVIACTIPLAVSYGPLGWDVKDPFEAIREKLQEYENIIDNWILLSHLGINYDRKIAKEFPELDVIIGAHTHHLLPEGERVNQTLLTGAGKFDEHVGQIDLYFDQHTVKMAKATVISVEEEIPAVPDEKQLAKQYIQIGHELLQKQKIAEIPNNLVVDWNEQTNFVDIAMEAIRDYANTDSAILNAGLFLQPLIEGDVTNDDLHRALPHPMRILKFSLKGRALKLLIESMEEQKDRLRTLPIKGLGFRGEVFGQLCYKDIQIIDRETIMLKGQPLIDEQVYSIATVDHYLFVPFFPEITNDAEYEVLFPHFLRKIVGQYLNKRYPINME